MKLNFKDINFERIIYGRRFLLISIVLALLAMSLVFFAIMPQFQLIFDTQTTLQSQRKALTVLQNKVSSLGELPALQAFEKSKQVDLALPSKKPLLQLIASTNAVAQESGVKITNIELSPGKISTGSARVGAVVGPNARSIETKQGDNDILTIEIEIKGTLGQINQFVDQLERVTPIIDITQIQLERAVNVPSVSASPSEEFHADMTLTTYYFTKALVVGVDTPLPEIGKAEQDFLTQLDTFIFPEVPDQNSIQGGGQFDLFGVNKFGEAQ
jgi:Tfp pilus assembly protein PilO